MTFAALAAQKATPDELERLLIAQAQHNEHQLAVIEYAASLGNKAADYLSDWLLVDGGSWEDSPQVSRHY